MPAGEPPEAAAGGEGRSTARRCWTVATRPGPPPRRSGGRGCLWGCAGALTVVIALAAVVMVIALGEGDESVTPAPSKTVTEGRRANDLAGDDGRTPGRASRPPRLPVGRSLALRGPRIWIVWTIKNNSSEKSDYLWDWEAVDASGTRLDNGTQLVTDVQPGQTARGEDFTTLDSVQGVTLNITSFDRFASG